jgi:hypothetical protein
MVEPLSPPQVFSPDAHVAPEPAAAAKDNCEDNKDKKRTLGMWVTDGIVYPLVTNPAVWALSVGATYLTEKGGERIKTGEVVRNTSGKDIVTEVMQDKKLVEHVIKEGEVIGEVYERKFGWLGDQMAKRGKWLDGKFMKMGMKAEGAQMARIVAFSFIDGSLLEPITSALEKKRGDMSEGIDNMLGTQPKDKSVYDDEPARGDGSLLLGRAMTAGIVVPTAVALEKTNPFAVVTEKVKDESGKEIEQVVRNAEGKASFKSSGFFSTKLRELANKYVYKDKPILSADEALSHELYDGRKVHEANANDYFFGKFGAGHGKRVQELMEKPELMEEAKVGHRMLVKATQGLEKTIGRSLDKPLLGKIVVFEAFYTSVCTAGLYLSSLLFADKVKDKKEIEQKEIVKKAESILANKPNPAADFTSKAVATDQWAARKVAEVTQAQPQTKITPRKEYHLAHDTETVQMPAQQPAL